MWNALTKFSVNKCLTLEKLLGEMAQFIAATVRNEIQISKVKSIFLHAAQRYVNETLYSVFLDTTLAS